MDAIAARIEHLERTASAALEALGQAPAMNARYHVRRLDPADHAGFACVCAMADELNRRHAATGAVGTQIQVFDPETPLQAQAKSTFVVTAVDAAADGTGILGFSVHGSTTLDCQRAAILRLIAVDPERQSRGVGRRLVEHFFFEVAAPLVQRRELEMLVLTHCTARMARVLVRMGIAQLIEPRPADWEDLPSAYLKHAPRIPWRTHFTASWRPQEARALAIADALAVDPEAVVVFDVMAAARLAGATRAYGVPLDAFAGIGGCPLYGWARDVQARGSSLLFR